jgi:hypothetical protein
MVKLLLYPGVLLTLLCSCGNIEKKDDHPKLETASTSGQTIKAPDRHLNINVLWDLSDRINNEANPASPPHFERDIEIIRYLTEIFKKDMQKKGAYKAKSKIRIFFTPPPQNDKINEIARNLSFDLSTFSGDQSNKNKKYVYDSITQVFIRNARTIYDLTIKASTTSGILTDGYIYHKDSRDRQENRTAYILPANLKPLRNNKHWKKIFKEKDYGLISTRKDLQNLEILVLEISTSAGNRNDEDILKEYLIKWFSEMGVESQNIACHNTDLPEYTKEKIAEFLTR